MTAYALLSHFGTDNIGDDIQAVAAARFLPRVDRFVDREELSSDPGGPGPIRLILNGWFMHRPRNWPPHAKLRPLPVSLHVARGVRSRRRPWAPTIASLMLSRDGRDWLNRFGPVGTRDMWTLDLLQRQRIESYHSGCLTLTLPPGGPRAAEAEVVACDLAPALLCELTDRLGAPPRTVSHLVRTDMAVKDRIAKAEALLEVYAGAAAVVTTRLHCALPCLALGTPVLFVDTGFEPWRCQPAIDLAHSCSPDDFLARRDGFDPLDPPSNPGRHVAHARDLASRCRAFVGSAREKESEK
jgi:hypothetical protein